MKPAVVLLMIAGMLPGVEISASARLAKIRRVYVEPLTGGAVGTQMRDMLIAAMEHSGLYTLTEDAERADAVLRGSADDQVFTENHNTSDTIGFNTRAGASSQQSNRANVGAGVTQRESSRIQERHHEAAASVRLVDKDGDVIWSTTQESAGGKFRGALADVADKVARNLMEQTRRVRSDH